MWRERLKKAGWWLVRDEAGDLSDVERAQFEEWRQDQANAQAFEAARRTLERVRVHRRALSGMVDESARARPSRRLIMGAGAVAASGLLGVGLWFGFGAPVRYSTEVGRHREIALTDGSQVFLNTDSAVSVRMSSTRRDVTLVRGEAFFDVASDPHRPFVVTTDEESVRAVGTAFLVRLHEDGLAVTVREGRVDVRRTSAVGDASASSRLLLAGERYERRGRSETVQVMSDYDIGRSLAWREGILWFEGEPLRQVLDEVSRHTGVAFVLSDPELGDVAITAYVRADNLDTLAARIEAAYPEIAVRRTGEQIVIERRVGPRE